MRKLAVSGLALTLFILAGCNALLDRATREYSVTLEPESLIISRGETGDLTVGISVPTGVDFGSAAAEIYLLEPPDGVSAERITIPAEGQPRTLTVEVAADAPALVDETITVEADKGGLARTAEFKLTVN